jgi:hypothetical protein
MTTLITAIETPPSEWPKYDPKTWTLLRSNAEDVETGDRLAFDGIMALVESKTINGRLVTLRLWESGTDYVLPIGLTNVEHARRSDR